MITHQFHHNSLQIVAVDGNTIHKILQPAKEVTQVLTGSIQDDVHRITKAAFEKASS